MDTSLRASGSKIGFSGIPKLVMENALGRCEIDLLRYVSILALTQIAALLQSDRTMLLAWRCDLQVMCDQEAAGGEQYVS